MSKNKLVFLTTLSFSHKVHTLLALYSTLLARETLLVALAREVAQ